VKNLIDALRSYGDELNRLRREEIKEAKAVAKAEEERKK